MLSAVFDRLLTRHALLAAMAIVSVFMLPISGAGALQAQKCRDCDSSARVASDLEMRRKEIERLRRQIETALRTLEQSSGSLETGLLRETEEQLRQAARRLEIAQRQTASEMNAVRASERVSERVAVGGYGRGGGFGLLQNRQSGHPGWLGVTLSSAAESVGERDGKPMWKFNAYPMAEAVEPGSPADHAGLQAGDVLLAFDGRDLKTSFLFLDDMIRPGNTLPIKLRRDGESKTVKVKVGQKPRGFQFQFETDAPPGSAPRAPVIRTTPRVRVVSPALPPEPAHPPMPSVAPYVWGATSSVVAGASLAPINDDLRDYFGVESGLLVLRVGAQTPASRAKLRGGDVIVTANGEAVESVQELREAIGEAGDQQTVKLDVVRKQEKIKLTLRW